MFNLALAYLKNLYTIKTRYNNLYKNIIFHLKFQFEIFIKKNWICLIYFEIV